MILAFTVFFLWLSPTKACDIPVFRYALTYWHADPYEAIIFHNGAMSPGEKNLMDRLQKASVDMNSSANVAIRSVNLTVSSDPIMQKTWKDQANPELPWIVLRYPRKSGINEDVWAGRLNNDNVAALLDSPVRKEIARRLIKGEAAVWVLLDGGDKQQDDETAKLLGSCLDKMPKKLKISDQSSQQFIEEEISFSMMRVSRKDTKEKVFIQMLIHSEPDLKVISKPIAFPVFGRGRVLYALVGDGINEGNIRTTWSSITGWCSCEIKDQNPGLDMLMSADWDSAISSGLFAESNSIKIDSGKSSNIKRNILVAIIIQIICIGVVGCVVLWRRRARS